MHYTYDISQISEIGRQISDVRCQMSDVGHGALGINTLNVNTNMTTSEENILVRRAQNGDREALGMLWDRLTPKLFGYLINTTRHRALAEDLLQTTWLKAIDALPGFEIRGSGISAWLFAIARNECQMYWRKSNRETEFDPVEHENIPSDENNSEDKILVDQVLRLLSEDDRELLRLRYIADLSPNDIARILKINFVTVRVRLHRALSRARLAALVEAGPRHY